MKLQIGDTVTPGPSCCFCGTTTMDIKRGTLAYRLGCPACYTISTKLEAQCHAYVVMKIPSGTLRSRVFGGSADVVKRQCHEWHKNERQRNGTKHPTSRMYLKAPGDPDFKQIYSWGGGAALPKD